jgi:hypothetical protein
MRTFLEYVFAQHSPQIQTFVDYVYRIIRSRRFNSIPFDANLSSEFYEFLTASAHGTEDKKYGISVWPHDDPNHQKEQQDIYLKTLANIKSPWVKNALPPWFSFYRITNDEIQKKQYTFKRYLTLPNNDDYKLTEVQKLGELVKQLDDVKSAFSLKIPLYITWLYEGIDNVVIYYTDPNDKQAIDQAILNSGIKEKNRSEFFRSNHGVDKRIYGVMKSDTELTADYMAKKFTQSLTKKLPLLRNATEIQAKNTIAEVLLEILSLESDHRTNYDKDPFDYE